MIPTVITIIIVLLLIILFYYYASSRRKKNEPTEIIFNTTITDVINIPPSLYDDSGDGNKPKIVDDVDNDSMDSYINNILYEDRDEIKELFDNINQLMVRTTPDYVDINNRFEDLRRRVHEQQQQNPLIIRDLDLRYNRYRETVPEQVTLPAPTIPLVTTVAPKRIIKPKGTLYKDRDDLKDETKQTLEVLAVLNEVEERTIKNDTQSTHDSHLYASIKNGLEKFNTTKTKQELEQLGRDVFFKRLNKEKLNPNILRHKHTLDNSVVPFNTNMSEYEYLGRITDYIDNAGHTNKDDLWESVTDCVNDWVSSYDGYCCSTGRVTKVWSAFTHIDQLNPVETKTKPVVRSEILNTAGKLMIDHQDLEEEELKKLMREKLSEKYLVDEFKDMEGEIKGIINECVEAI